MEESGENNIPQDQPKNGSSGGNDDDGIGFINLVAMLWKRKALVLGVTLVVMAGVFAYAIGSIVLPPEKSYLPNVYTLRASMLIQLVSSSSSSTSAALSGFGHSGLMDPSAAETAGGTNGNLAEVLVINSDPFDVSISGSFAELLATSNATLDALEAKFGFSTTSNTGDKKISVSKTREKIKKSLDARMDLETALFIISFTDFDPKRAKEVIEETIRLLEAHLVEYRNDIFLKQEKILEKKLAYLNTSARELEKKISETSVATAVDAGLQNDLAIQRDLLKILRQQYELAKLDTAIQEPVLKIMEAAELPDEKSGPSRSKIFLTATMEGFFFAILLALLVEWVEKIKSDTKMFEKFNALISKKNK